MRANEICKWLVIDIPVPRGSDCNDQRIQSLSTNQERVPLYPDHDMELSFDVEIDVDDIRDVNTLRLLIHNALDGDVQSESMQKSHSEMKRSQVTRQHNGLKLSNRRIQFKLKDIASTLVL